MTIIYEMAVKAKSTEEPMEVMEILSDEKSKVMNGNAADGMHVDPADAMNVDESEEINRNTTDKKNEIATEEVNGIAAEELNRNASEELKGNASEELNGNVSDKMDVDEVDEMGENMVTELEENFTDKINGNATDKERENAVDHMSEINENTARTLSENIPQLNENSSEGLQKNITDKIMENATSELCKNTSGELNENTAGELNEFAAVEPHENIALKLNENSANTNKLKEKFVCELNESSAEELNVNASSKLSENAALGPKEDSSVVAKEDTDEEMSENVVAKTSENSADEVSQNSKDSAPNISEADNKRTDDNATNFASFLVNCKALIFEKHKDSFESMIQDVSSKIKNISDLMKQTERASQNMTKFLADNRSIFKTLIPSEKQPNKVGGKSPIKSSVNAQDELEILSTVTNTHKADLPPVGEVVRRELQVGTRVWVMKTSLKDRWVKGSIIEVDKENNEKLYRVLLDSNRPSPPRLFPAKRLAYDTSPNVIVPVGTRIISRYKFPDVPYMSNVYAGIVAEVPKVNNFNRYLVFFDDGCAQYVKHQDIFVVCAQSVDVANDCCEIIREFVREYLLKFPERPMVKLQKGQQCKTELNVKWHQAEVVEVDCSLVRMRFVGSRKTEWIYRGSSRLAPLCNELANAEAHRLEGKNRRRHNIPRKPHEPYIEYTREDIIVLSDSDEENKPKVTSPIEVKPNKPRNTARKSLATRPFTMLNVRTNPVYHVTDKKSHLGYRDKIRIKEFKRTSYIVHDCSVQCRESHDPQNQTIKNPLLKPIISGWERQLRKFRVSGPGPKQVVTYRSICGRHIRNLQEVENYLYQTKSKLTVDFFSFDPSVQVFRAFRPLEILYENKDITQGKENIPVSCVNSLTNEPPPYVEYSAERFPGEGVHLNLDPNFLCGCSCTDNCQNADACECRQLTNYAKYGTNTGDAGYKFRRLKEPVVTGIYECNSQCSCNAECGNRVVQNGLHVRLQMFKTQYKGWGIRCLDDIDAGQFICVYAGQLLTEQGADQDGKECGDEYLAELDHIEVVEKTKEGYEADVPEFRMEQNDERKDHIRDDDDDFDVNMASDDSYLTSDFGLSSSDSEYERSSLRNTATSTYATRTRRQRTCKRESFDSTSNITLDDSNSFPEIDKKDKNLPDLSLNLDSIKINPQPPSPESAQVLEKLELKRKPKIPEKAQRSVAKKSFSMKNNMNSFSYEHKHFKFKSVRCYFGEESLYIMDAKSKGNIGRYLNHSCEPNVFVQNVFVDTHDLRFPCVAFFAHDTIDAGTELTWDYNYEVGSVADKVMYCYCEAASCRGRLL